MTGPFAPEDMVCVGAVSGSYGVRGEVRLKSFCADPAAIEDYAPLTTEDGQHSFSIQLTGQLKNGLTARMGGITSKEAADALRGTRLYAPRNRLPSLPDDEYYHADLIGIAVLDTGGTELGNVAAVHNHGAADLLEVRLPGRTETVLVPFTLAVVPTVDLASRRIIVDPPEGLFPDAPEPEDGQ